MASYSLSSLINAFCDKYLSHCDKSDDFLYFYDSPNTIRVEPVDKSRPQMIFMYNGRDDWKLSTLKCATREDLSIKDLRKELNDTQSKFVNFKRRRTT